MGGDGHTGSVTGFLLAVTAFFVAMVGTTLPTPLYPLFEQRYSFGPLLVTVIFAIYAFGVIAGSACSSPGSHYWRSRWQPTRWPRFSQALPSVVSARASSSAPASRR